MDSSKFNSILNKYEISEYFDNFFHACVNEICGAEKPMYKQYMNIGWTEDEFHYVHTIIHSLYVNPKALNIDKSELPCEFLSIPEDIQKRILNCLNGQRQRIINALMKELSQKQIQTMIDFDWRLKVIMGSSTIASLRELLIQLDLKILGKNIDNILEVEMDKTELDCFIKVLDLLND